VSALLKDVHDALRGLRTEIDLPGESSWSKQLAVLHADISRLLSAEIELMPGRVRRLVRPRPSKEISPNSVLDPHEVDEAEAMIVFVLTCRKYASEVAINEVTQRTFNELQHLLDTGTRTLLDALRAAVPAERTFRQSQVDAASAPRCSARNTRPCWPRPRRSPPMPSSARWRRSAEADAGPSAQAATLIEPSRLSTITGELR
jgi:hypothetical protein